MNRSMSRSRRYVLFIVPICAVFLAGGVAAASDGGGLDGLDISGDFRVRSEANTSDDGGSQRHRGVLRLRVGAAWSINDVFDVGARLVTGDSGNPRTADVTMSDFTDDLEFSLDRAFLRAELSSATVSAGKMPNPFATTELVWDNDVNPTGVGGEIRVGTLGGLTARLAGALTVVDEDAVGEDSTMWGGQLQLGGKPGGSWGVEVALGYWDYELESLAGADDPGDRRGNYSSADGGGFLSDFDLADVQVRVDLPGPSAEYPVRLILDYVKNVGAAVGEDQGYWAEVRLGEAWSRGRMFAKYGFAACETDAVLGTYSHDNIPLATNYEAHTLSAAYGLLQDTSLGLTWYYFRQLDTEAGVIGDAYETFSSRVRLDLMVRF